MWLRLESWKRKLDACISRRVVTRTNVEQDSKVENCDFYMLDSILPRVGIMANCGWAAGEKRSSRLCDACLGATTCQAYSLIPPPRMELLDIGRRELLTLVQELLHRYLDFESRLSFCEDLERVAVRATRLPVC